MKTTFNTTLVLLALGNCTLDAQESFKLVLDDLPQLIAKQNKHYQAAKCDLDAQNTRTGHLTRSFLPELTVEAALEQFKTGAYSIKTQPKGAVAAKINLFNGFRDSLQDAYRESVKTQGFSEKNQIYFNELSEARKLYWGMIYNKEILQLFKTAVEMNEKGMASALKRIKAGIATNTDKLEFEIAKIQLVQNIARHELKLANNQRKLSALLNLPLSTQYESAQEIPHEHDDITLKSELNTLTHRDIVKLQATGFGSEKLQKSMSLWWSPKLDVYGGYALYNLREKDSVAMAYRQEALVGAQISMQLFDGLQSSVESQHYARLATAAQLRLEQTQNGLQAGFESTKQELKLVHDLAHEAEKNIEKSKEYLALTLAEYTRGIKNSPDVLGAMLKYIEFKKRSVELRRDYQISKIELLSILEK